MAMNITTLRKMAKRLPGTRDEYSYGTPAFKVGKKMFARLHHEEDAVVLFFGSIDERDALIASDPATFYLIDHYANYAAVLVRLTVTDDRFFELLERAWRRVARKVDIQEYEAKHAKDG